MILRHLVRLKCPKDWLNVCQQTLCHHCICRWPSTCRSWAISRHYDDSIEDFPQNCFRYHCFGIFLFKYCCSAWLWDHPSVLDSNGHVWCYIEVIYLAVYISHQSLGYRTGRWITWLHVTTLWYPRCRCIHSKSHSSLTQITVIHTWHILNVFPNWYHCPIVIYYSS